jgi:VTC domain-containing protein
MSVANSNGYTSEIKFLLDEATGLRVREWARERLDADPNGTGPHGDEYRVSTLYLDTAARDVFHRRGSYGRSKLRIRRYGDEPRVFLERKLRTGARLAKRRTDIPLDELHLLKALDSGDHSTRWFRDRVSIRQLKPVCRVSYLRTARLAATADGRVRMTLDYSLSASTADAFALDGAGPAGLLPGQMILELKYRGAMPAVFRELADVFKITPGRASKYRVAADALGIATLEREQGQAPTLNA